MGYWDFVVFNNKLFMERKTLDESFITSAVEQGTVFFKCAVLPEIVGKWFTKTFDLPAKEFNTPTAASCSLTSVQEDAGDPAKTVPAWCYCKEQKPCAISICTNNKCNIQTFHLSCMKLKSKSVRRSWLCSEGRRLKSRTCRNKSISLYSARSNT